jgi:DNA-binding MarR family transcriptional regulator
VRSELAASGFPDIAAAHGAVFALVGRSGARVTDMAARMGVSKQAVVLLVNQLEEAGYVRRVDDDLDGRAKLVQLTDRGRQAAATSRRAAQALDRRWATVLGAEQLRACKQALQDVLNSMAEPAGTNAGSGRWS